MAKRTDDRREPQSKDGLVNRSFRVEYVGASGGKGPFNIRVLDQQGGWILAQPLDVVTGADASDPVWISPAQVIVLRYWQPRED